MAFITGTTDSETLNGTADADIIEASDGNDTLNGLGGDDTLFGGGDNDIANGADGNDLIDGGLGDDWLIGGLGNDYINGADGGDRIEGGNGNDALYGVDGDDVIFAGGAHDVVFGGLGNDRIFDGTAEGVSGSGVDIFDGGEGNDTITILRQTLTHVSQTIAVNGGNGHDVVDYTSARNDTGNVDLSYGDDRFILRDVGAGVVNLTVGEGHDVIEWRDGPDYPAQTATDDPALVISDFNEGEDQVDLSAILPSLNNWSGSNPFATQHFRLVQDGDAVLLQVDYNGINDEGVIGGAEGVFDYYTLIRFENCDITKFSSSNFPAIPLGGLTIIGDLTDETIGGSAFEDSLSGQGGNDILLGLGGDDLLNGDYGNDLLLGGTGSDAMYGGFGNDSYEVDDAGDTVNEAANAGFDVVFSSVNFRLGAHVENLAFNVPGSTAVIGTGNGLDNLIVGNDLNNRLSGVSGDDLLQGGDGNDTLNGGAGADVLRGEAGNDVLEGGAGSDVLIGSTGADRYVFTAVYATSGDTDTVRFSVEDGDRLDLRRIDAISGGANDAFAFIGDAAFSGAAGELRYELAGGWNVGGGPDAGSGNIYMVSGDVDGDGVADFAIQLQVNGGAPLTAGDFLL